MKSINKKLITAFLSLLLITVASTGILSGVYAGYYTSDSASVSALVAVFAVDISGEGSDLVLDASGNSNTSANNAYIVTNKTGEKVTEVGVSYQVVVTLSKALPTGTSISIRDSIQNNVIATPTPVENNGSYVYTFTDAEWTFAAGVEGSNTIQVVFTTDNSDGNAVADDIDVTVTITATQIIV